GNGGGGCDGYGGGAHHGMVELAHRHGTHQQIDIRSADLFTARGHVIRGLGHKRHFRSVLAIGGFRNILDQAHFHGTVSADGFKHGQRFGVAVDVVLQLSAFVPDIFGVHENGGYAGVDHGGFQCAHTRHFQVVDQIAGGEHGTFAIGGVHELDFHFRRRKGHAIQLKITGFLHFSIRDGDMGNDGFLDVGLPDPDHAGAVFRDAVFRDKATVDGKGTDGGSQVATVAAPVNKGLIDGHLAKQVVHVMARLGRCRQDNRFTGTGGGVTQAADLLLVGVRAADDSQQELVSGFTGDLTGFWQVLQSEERTFAGAATHVRGGHFDLRGVHHAAPSDARKFWAKRCSTPPAAYTVTSSAVSNRQVTGTRSTSPVLRWMTSSSLAPGAGVPSTS